MALRHSEDSGECRRSNKGLRPPSGERLWIRAFQALFSAMSQHLRICPSDAASPNAHLTEQPFSTAADHSPLRRRRPPSPYRAGSRRSKHVFSPADSREVQWHRPERLSKPAPSDISFERRFEVALQKYDIEEQEDVKSSASVYEMKNGSASPTVHPLQASLTAQHQNTTLELTPKTDNSATGLLASEASTQFRFPAFPRRRLRSWLRGRAEVVHVELPPPRREQTPAFDTTAEDNPGKREVQATPICSYQLWCNGMRV